MSEVSLTNEVPEGHVGIRIDENLARLALIAADGLQRMPAAELMKLESMLKANFGKAKPTARNVSDMFRLVGFTFSQALHEAREKRVQEREGNGDAAE